MRTIFLEKHLAIIDDFLPDEHFNKLSGQIEAEQMRPVHVDGYQLVWRHCDGVPLQGPPYYLHEPHNYPEFSIALHNLVLERDYNRIVGEMAKEWKTFTMQAYHYPQGTQLSWHDDAIKYSGAYVYYTHKQWNMWYGGELQVLPPFDHQAYVSLRSNELRDEFLNKQLLIGMSIAPKPNRLVLIRGGIMHKIHRVEPYAGRAVRQSIAGFFKKEL